VNVTRCAALAPALALALAACREPAPPGRTGGADPQARADSVVERNLDERIFERNVVFLTSGRDSVLVVPWFFTSLARRGGTTRRVRGWLARADRWEAFFDERWQTPPERAPFRILPRGPVSLIVGLDDALERISFEEGPRRLEVVLDALVADWAGAGGESFRIHEGALQLGDRQVPGRVLDMNRSRRTTDVPPGDWIFLEGGPDVAAVFEARIGVPATGQPYSGWARRGEASLRWTNVEVTWDEVRAFQDARRDVPVAWSLRSPDGEVAGALRSVAAWLAAGEGSGPLLPVDGLFQVGGTLLIEGDSIPVRGLVRHVQY